MVATEKEIPILIEEIRRLADPATPDQVKYGKLVRDDRVANRLEALVGTLRAARKQGKIEYEGEMLFQGVHDEVIIKVKEQKA